MYVEYIQNIPVKFIRHTTYKFQRLQETRQ